MAELFVLDSGEKIIVDITKVKRWPMAGEIISVGKKVFSVVNINTVFPDGEKDPYIQIMVSFDDKMVGR